MTCLRSWDRSGIVTLSQGLFNSAVVITLDEDDGFDEAASEARRFLVEDDV
jgi:hypothetical protein